MSGLYGNGIGLTETVLDYLWGRQNITLNNIANVDTPGFKAQYVTFEEELAKKIQNAGGADGRKTRSTIAEAIRSSRAGLRTTWNETTRLDGNNVDMDQEQVELVRTAYEYQQAANSINSELNRLRTVAKTF